MTRLKLWHNAAFCELLCHEKCLHSIANKYNSNIFCFYMERDLLYFFQRLCFSIINCTRILKRFWNSSWVLWWKLHFSNIPIDLSVVLDININAGNDQRRDRNPLKWKFTANISSREINYTMNTVTIVTTGGNLIIESVLDVDQFNPFQRIYFHGPVLILVVQL